MALNQNMIKGKWLEIKGDIQKSWGKLTNDDLEMTKGDLKKISGLIQQHYGEAQEKSSAKLTEVFKQFENKKESIEEEIKKK